MKENIFVTLICLVTTFITAEVFFRVTDMTVGSFEKHFPPNVVRIPQPYTMFGGKPNGEIEAWGQIIKLNENGYRGTTPSQPKPKNEYRIVMLGGSTVWNGFPPITELLEKELQQAGYGHAKVYNYGVVSSVSGQELVRLTTEVIETEPDLVIFYNGSNDLFQHYIYDPRPGYPMNYLVEERNPIKAGSLDDYPLFTLMAYGSATLRFIMPDYFASKFAGHEHIRDEIGFKTEEWRQKIIDSYIGNLKKASMVAHGAGADFIGIAQPNVYYKEHLHEKESTLVDPNMIHDAQDLQRKLQIAIANLPKTRIIDMTNFFTDTTEHVYTDYVHITQDAKQLIAKEIMTYIQPVIH